MLKIRLIFVIATLITLACGGQPLPAPKAVPPLGSRIELAAGDVWLVDNSQKRRLITGAMLSEEATVELGNGARALVRLGNGTGIFLRGGTKLKIDKESVVDLEHGEIWADVPVDEYELSRFNAGKTSITASGAGFDIKKSGDQVQVYVARGLAVVASVGGRAEIQNGERAVINSSSEVPTINPVGFWEDWTGGMADRELSVGRGGKGSGRIYGIDRLNPGSAPKDLQISSQVVRTIIKDGIAHTTVDQRFFNPASADVEGWYWFTIPEGASVERFALEVNGYLVEGEMTERNQAAEAYEEAVRNAVDPALLEWVDGRTFRARIFPILAAGERRVVLSYTQFLPIVDGSYRFVYPMGGPGEKRIGEFSLQVILAEEGTDYEVATLQDARIEKDSSMVSVRRSGYIPRSDFLLELRPTKKIEPLRVARYSTGGNEADYVMIRYCPDVDWSAIKEVQGDVVVVLDTSAGGGESERQIRADAAEAILRALSDSDRFAVVAADLTPTVVYPETGLANATEENIANATEDLSEIASAGATDLGEMFAVALKLVHESEQPAVVYVGDGRPTVGETSSMELAERLRRSLGDSRARLFTIAVGAEANHSLLERLSAMGGGRSFRIDTPEQTVQEAIRFAGLLKTPTITELEIDAGSGLDQSFTTVAGKVSEGKEVVLMARSHHELPQQIAIKGRLAGETFERKYFVEIVQGPEYGYVPSLWARMYLDRLMGQGKELNRGTIISLGLTYALMTPFTSFLVLENDQAYVNAGIQRRQRHHTWRGFDTDFGSNSGSLIPASFGTAGGVDDDLEKLDEMPRSGMEPSEESSFSRRRSKRNRQEATSEVVESAPDMTAAAPPPPTPSRGLRKSSPPKLTRAEGLGDVPSGRGSGGISGLGTGARTRDRRPSRTPRKPTAKKSAPKELTVDQLLEIALTAGSGPKTTSQKLFQPGICSDASRRSLSQRRYIWKLRLRNSKSPYELASVFFSAGNQCELPRWKHRKELLAMIERRAVTPSDVNQLLAQFDPYPKVQKYLRKRIIRRTLGTEISMQFYEPTAINWSMVRRGLAAIKSPEEKLKRLRDILANSPQDPAGRGLLIELLLDLDQVDEARAVAARLRKDEMASPFVLSILCDLQSQLGMEKEARRTCSELVEFNESDPGARIRLGDIFIRHGWYKAAYRQYNTLVEMVQDDPKALLRLAQAAAGMGKVDEALRIERKVAAGDGQSGPNDPRRWARLHSVVKLARMINQAKKSGDDSQINALERTLKRIQNFSDPMTLTLLVWEDFEANLDLVAMQGKKEFTISDKVKSYETGLVMIDLGPNPPSDLALSVRILTAPLRRSVNFSLLTVKWDGKQFSIAEKKGKLAPRALSVATD